MAGLCSLGVYLKETVATKNIPTIFSLAGEKYQEAYQMLAARDYLVREDTKRYPVLF